MLENELKDLAMEKKELKSQVEELKMDNDRQQKLISQVGFPK